MNADKRDAIVIQALREVPTRHVYEGSDGAMRHAEGSGRWWISKQGPACDFSTAEVEDMVKREVLELDFPGFYKLHHKHSLRKDSGT